MIPEDKQLMYQYSKGRRQMTVGMADSTEAFFVQVSICPPLQGDVASIVAPPIQMHGKTSFVDTLTRLRKSNEKYCDDDVWDAMKKTCIQADQRDWDKPTEPGVVYNGD